MRYILLLVLILHYSVSSGQRTINLTDFSYTVIDDTSELGHEEDPSAAFSEVVKELWKDPLYTIIDHKNRTFNNPLYFKGFLFVPNVIEYAFEASSGKRIVFGSLEAKQKFRNLGKDTLICYSGLHGFRTLVINVLTGEKIVEMDKQPENKSPFFLTNGIWLYMKWGEKTSSLVAKNLIDNTDIWSIPFQKFSFLRSIQLNDCLIVADSEMLYAIEIMTGKIVWRMPMRVNYMSQYENVIYVDSADGLLAIDVKQSVNPKVLWRIQSPDHTVDINFLDQFLYIQRSNSLLAFDTKIKKIVWKANFYFNFYPLDQIVVTDDFVITINTEDLKKYNLIFDRRTGKFITWNIDGHLAYSFAKKSKKNTAFAITDNGKNVFALELASIIKLK